MGKGDTINVTAAHEVERKQVSVIPKHKLTCILL